MTVTASERFEAIRHDEDALLSPTGSGVKVCPALVMAAARASARSLHVVQCVGDLWLIHLACPGQQFNCMAGLSLATFFVIAAMAES